MTSSFEISIPRKVALLFVELLIKFLWVIDKFTGFDIRYIFKTVFRLSILFVWISSLLFLGYSISTGYLHDVAVAYIVPEYVPLRSVELNYPMRVGTTPFPEITAISAIAVDREKGVVLYEKNPDEKLQPASTVKLMSSIIAFDLYNLDDGLTIPEICTQVEGTKAWFPKGTSYKVRDLIEGMLVGSAGDSACVLASSKVSEKEFVDMMNLKAVEIGMSSTLFSNPVGLDDESGFQYSTARDLYKMAVYATSMEGIREAVGKKNIVISSADQSYKAYLPNTNRFLWEIENTVGIKTGTTQGAGEVLIYEYDDDLKDIVIVVMGSKDRFNDTKTLLDWVIDNYRWGGLTK